MMLFNKENQNKKELSTLYQYASTKGLSTIQVDEALYRITRGLSIPDETLKIIVEYITQYIMLSKQINA